MRVLLVVHGFPPRSFGGTEVYTLSLARALRDLGDEVLVLARESDPRLPEYGVREEVREGLRIGWLNHTFRLARAFENAYVCGPVREAALRWIDQVAPEIAHVQHLTCLSSDLPLELKRRGMPVIVTLHDHWLLCHRGQLLNLDLEVCPGPFPAGCRGCLGEAAAPSWAAAPTRRFARWVPAVVAARFRRALAAELGDRGAELSLRRARFHLDMLARMDAVLAPSQSILERFLAAGVPAPLLQRRELGIDLSRFAQRGAVSPGPLQPLLPLRPLIIGFFGSLMVSKGLDILLQAFFSLAKERAELHVFGEIAAYHGDDSYRALVEPLLRRPGVVHHGAIPHHQVPRALGGVDVVVVPSIWPENSPLVVSEAFAAGVPVVVSRVGGIPELVRDGLDALVVPPRDTQALSLALRRLLDEPSLLPALRAAIRPPRSIEDDARSTREIYQECLGRGRGTPPAPPRRLAAVVLNYRTPQDTFLAVRSLQSSRRRCDEIVVVDNASGDGSVAWLRRHLPEVAVLETASNLGFSAGSNVGIRAVLKSGAEIVLLLNPDVILPPDSLARLEAALGQSSDYSGSGGGEAAREPVGIVGPLLLARSSPGLIASAGMTYEPRTGRMRHRLAGAVLDLAARLPSARVDGVAGCMMLVRRQVLEQVGLLAEEFFFGFEDLDLCLRAARAGWQTRLEPAARGYHQGGGSLPPDAPQRLYYGVRGHLLLAERNHSGPGSTGMRRVAIVAFNIAHALRQSQVPRLTALRAVLRGVTDSRSRPRELLS